MTPKPSIKEIEATYAAYAQGGPDADPGPVLALVPDLIGALNSVVTTMKDTQKVDRHAALTNPSEPESSEAQNYDAAKESLLTKLVGALNEHVQPPDLD